MVQQFIKKCETNPDNTSQCCITICQCCVSQKCDCPPSCKCDTCDDISTHKKVFLDEKILIQLLTDNTLIIPSSMPDLIHMVKTNESMEFHWRKCKLDQVVETKNGKIYLIETRGDEIIVLFKFEGKSEYLVKFKRRFINLNHDVIILNYSLQKGERPKVMYLVQD
ncbi:hypothetical protein CPAV1605_1022 [seawater metagenome]|uniref:Uncharacterized protein n=1 Tax=seawater metagenome TaxID=1561972 RepID=A0A5E8CKN0_9ZZZZ